MPPDEGKSPRVRRSRIAVGAFVLVLALTVGFRCLREPRIEGRTLSVWLVDLVSPEANKREAATQVIQKYGPALAPELLPYLRERKSHLRSFIYKSPKTTLWMRKWAPGLERRYQIEMGAFRALTLLGPQGKPALPALVKMVSDPSAETRRRAAWVLGVIGPEAGKAAPELCLLVRDLDPNVRLAAARALGTIGAESKLPVFALLGALHSGDKRLAAEAVTALGDLGIKAQVAIPSLLAVLEQADWTQTFSSAGPIPPLRYDIVCRAISRIGLQNTTHALQFVRLCREKAAAGFHQTSILRSSALQIVAGSESNLRLLIQICRDPKQAEEDRLALLPGFGSLARGHVALTDLFIELLNEKRFRVPAAHALESCGSLGGEAVPRLVELMLGEAKDDAAFCRQALAVLQRARPLPREIFADLLLLANDHTFAFRLKAWESLLRYGPRSELGHLADVHLAYTDWRARKICRDCPKGVPSLPADIESALRNRLRDERLDVRLAAAVSLVEMYARIPEVIEIISQEIRNQDRARESRIELIWALGHLGVYRPLER